MLTIEVAYATRSTQKVISLNVTDNTAVLQAIIESNISLSFPELAGALTTPDTLLIGVFGKKIDPHTYVLQQNDRIEIYRPLTMTPNQKRLARAKSPPK